MNKRTSYELKDIVLIGSCSTILGVTDNYQDVIDFHDRVSGGF